MHNFDRTVGEMEFGFSNEFQGENHEMFGESYEFGQQETGGFQGENSPLHETLEMELASELLSVQNEAELEQFLGGLFKKVVSGAKAFANSAAGKAIGGMLKNVAKKALPIAGAALGNMIVPGIGGAIGGKLAGMAGNAFGLELEGLSAEDREFEIARAYVRFASDAARRAATDPRSRFEPQPAARAAMYGAAQMHAPGLLSSSNDYNSNQMVPNQGSNFRDRRSSMSGRWVRRGTTITIYGI